MLPRIGGFSLGVLLVAAVAQGFRWAGKDMSLPNVLAVECEGEGWLNRNWWPYQAFHRNVGALQGTAPSSNQRA
jgi:hypothetical protein